MTTINSQSVTTSHPKLSKPGPRVPPPPPPLDDTLDKLKSEIQKIFEFILKQHRIIAPILLPPVRVRVSQILGIEKELNIAQVVPEEALFFIIIVFWSSAEMGRSDKKGP